ncbi:MAG TPA: hypothetical protein VHE78_06945 [Gemmatimonadaceae bacterium]|nr:hypothetical protein [Gemmatimonadaceae bacterium]
MPEPRRRSIGFVLQRLAIIALVLGAGFTGACSDPFKVKAQFDNADQPFFVHALTGAPLPFATALALPAKSVTRVDGTFAFDVAFDLNARGDILLLPVRVVGQSPGGSRQVGIFKPGGAYENIASAPVTGYVFDSVTVLRKGEAAVIQAQEAACALSLSPYMYARIVIDSVDLVGRAMYGRTTININCGFRSLKTGLPDS